MVHRLALGQWSYLALLGGCLAVTFPLEFFYGFRLWRNPRRLAKAVLPGAAIFSIWDIFAIERAHWTFSDRYTTGWILPGGMPFEELIFFIVIPTAGIAGFEAVTASLARRERSPRA